MESGLLFPVLCVYFVLLFVLGWMGYRRRVEASPDDFYLAGKKLGVVVLFATLYATQYSGNTFLGYTGQAYRIGFAWVMSVGMMMSIVFLYLLFAPVLHREAHRHGFLTPGDWIEHRFGDRRLRWLASAIMAFSLLNYLYAQFLAMGHIAVSLSGGTVPFWAGVLVLAVVIGFYETLGGMRSVAWTDVLQGAMLLVGLGAVLLLVWSKVESLESVTRPLVEEGSPLVAVPSWETCATWVSSVALLGLGGCVYPQAIQRIYAARDPSALRRALRVMVWMPLATTFVVFLVGLLAHGILPGRSGIAADRVMPELLYALSREGTLASLGSALVLVGALAAIMSTADSALLTLSSILAWDFYGVRREKKTSAETAALGKWFSWGIIAFLFLLAVRPPTTLWRLIEIKMELLMQVAPIVIFGARSPHLSAKAALVALGTGTSLALGGFLGGVDRLGGFHTGSLACAGNALLCYAAIARARRRRGVSRPSREDVREQTNDRTGRGSPSRARA
ncbi:MAG: hypothetical protein KatS3mg076_3033 [Candidatus Binatia bacterium]|nr:MAG: hypothetical protein KatS3mg076_3033 [Candidatus Binatia bacterium]